MGKTTTIYVARHGFRTSWIANFQGATPTGTKRDVELTAYGETQAQELARFLADQGIQAIYSSPWYRCVQTARPIAARLGLPIELEPGLGEWYLPALPGTGLHPFPQLSQLKQLFPAVASTHAPLVFPSRSGETREELHRRIEKTLTLLLAELDELACPPKAILLMGHAATVIPIGRVLVGDPTLDVRTGCCSLSKYVRQGDGSVGSWTSEYTGRADFLSGGEERHWAFEDIDGQVHEAGAGEGGTKL